MSTLIMQGIALCARDRKLRQSEYPALPVETIIHLQQKENKFAEGKNGDKLGMGKEQNNCNGIWEDCAQSS